MYLIIHDRLFLFICRLLDNLNIIAVGVIKLQMPHHRMAWGSHSEKEMTIGRVIFEISRKNDVHNNYETDYSSYCCIYHNTSNGDKIVMKCVAFLMFILYIFSQEIIGDNGRRKCLHQIMVVSVQLINSLVATLYQCCSCHVFHLGLYIVDNRTTTS